MVEQTDSQFCITFCPCFMRGVLAESHFSGKMGYWRGENHICYPNLYVKRFFQSRSCVKPSKLFLHCICHAQKLKSGSFVLIYVVNSSKVTKNMPISRQWWLSWTPSWIFQSSSDLDSYCYWYITQGCLDHQYATKLVSFAFCWAECQMNR